MLMHVQKHPPHAMICVGHTGLLWRMRREAALAAGGTQAEKQRAEDQKWAGVCFAFSVFCKWFCVLGQYACALVVLHLSCTHTPQLRLLSCLSCIVFNFPCRGSTQCLFSVVFAKASKGQLAGAVGRLVAMLVRRALQHFRCIAHC